MLTSLPPLEILTKNLEILGFETYILSYHYYLLRVRGTERETHRPFPEVVRNWLGQME